MNADQLLALYGRVAEATDAIARLRRFVLDLAVRGKLVEQDLADESALELLKRLKIAKISAYLCEKLRARLPITKLGRKDLKFDFPDTWELASFDDLFVIVSGVTKGQKIPANEAIEVPYLRVANVQRGHLDLTVIKTITVRKAETERYALRNGDILMTEGGDWDKLGRAAIWHQEVASCIHQNHIFRVRPPSSDILPEWVVTYVNSQLGRTFFEDAAKQTTNLASINMTQLRACPIPLPPIAEQHRIVAKVDELMALCDQLEAAHTAREATRDRLTTASLTRLTAPDTDAETFRSHTHFALDALPALTTRPDQIKALRQTIINLAVRGKLVEQDAADQPVQVKVPSLKLHPEILPSSWHYVRLQHLLAEDTRNGYSRRPDDAVDGVPILRISAGTVRQDGIVAEEEHKLISGIDVAARIQYGLAPGDLLACRFNGNKFFVGRLTLFKNYLGLNPIYPDKLIRVRVSSTLALPEFVRLAGESDLVRNALEESCATTVGNWGISASNLKEVPFPLPPLAEQHRIVAKVDALMALCDRLETSLATADTTRRRLLEALLHEALEPAAGALEAAE